MRLNRDPVTPELSEQTFEAVADRDSSCRRLLRRMLVGPIQVSDHIGGENRSDALGVAGVEMTEVGGRDSGSPSARRRERPFRLCDRALCAHEALRARSLV